jgi:hypothetical protein
MNTPSPETAPVKSTALGIVAALLSLPASAAIWLPFAWSTSPARALTDGELWYLAVPFLLAIPIAGAHAWTLARGSLSGAAQWGARALAGGAMAVTALCFAKLLREENWPGPHAGEWLAFLLPLAVSAGWVTLMARSRPGRRPFETAEAIAIMEAAYLANAALCLISFADMRQAGWYLTLAASAAFAAHAVAAAAGSRRPSAAL